MLRDNIQNNVESISLKDLSEYVTESIKNLEPNTGLFLIMQVEITDIFIMDNQSFKMLANMIAHNIEEGDAPRLLTCHKNVSTFYFGCSQFYELARDCKESNRQRMNHFDCHGKLIIKIDIPVSKVIIKLKHNIIYEIPVNITTPMEIKQAIIENLNLDPTQLRIYFHDRFDISKITMQQIHYCRANGYELCYELINSQIIAIGFTIPLFKNKQLVTEVHCDVTYKTAKGASEDDSQNENRTYALSAKATWPEANIQLCLWHLEKALSLKLKSKKKVQCIYYQVENAIAEFDFINPDFKPNLENCKFEYYK
ncbi:8394_t:CDS:2, partial [Gigaspora margarita]